MFEREKGQVVYKLNFYVKFKVIVEELFIYPKSVPISQVLGPQCAGAATISGQTTITKRNAEKEN